MKRPEYQNRVLDELNELEGRLGRLSRFINGEASVGLPPSELARLYRQLYAMQAYADVLRERIAAFAEPNKADILIGKKKSRELLAGTLAWRKKQPKLVVKDEEQLLEWLPSQDPKLYRVKIQPELAALKELVATTGVIPPGCDYEPERDELSIKATPFPTLTATATKKEIAS